MVFTSRNGVDIFFDYLLSRGKDIRSLAGVKFGVIGEGTKRALAARGICADFVPTRYSSKDMASEWVPTLHRGDRVLMLRAEEASLELNRALTDAGIDYTAAALYHTCLLYTSERGGHRDRDSARRDSGKCGCIGIGSSFDA